MYKSILQTTRSDIWSHSILYGIIQNATDQGFFVPILFWEKSYLLEL